MKPRGRTRGSTLFVTVGSTKFDKLIAKIFSEYTIQQILDLGFSLVVAQVGQSEFSPDQVEKLRSRFINLNVEYYDYKQSIAEDIERADVVIGHAGAGTCLEVLRKSKRLLIVTNDTLMDNHQNELATELAEKNFVVQTSIENFNRDLALICDRNTKLDIFPQQNPALFEEIFDEALKRVTSRL